MRKKTVMILALILGILCGSCAKETPKKSSGVVNMGYTQEEVALLHKYRESFKGLKVTYYSGKQCDGVIGEAVIEDLNDTFGPNNKALSAVYKGYICFTESGKHTLSVDLKGSYTIDIIYSALRKTPYTKDAGIEFLADIYYYIQIICYNDTVDEETKAVFNSSCDYVFASEEPTFGGEFSIVEPIDDIRLRDPQVIIGQDGYYYMTGTYEPIDWSCTKEIHLYKSEDLLSWEDLGAVWSFEKDSTWHKALVPEGTSPLWAPEIHYLKGNYWICYSIGWGSMTCSILKSTTGLPTGPYEEIMPDGPLVTKGIDATLFEDSDGSIYLIYADGVIAKMNDELNGFVEDFKKLSCVSGRTPGYEGCTIIKLSNGLYYLMSAIDHQHLTEEGTSHFSYETMYCFSDNIYGPYSEPRLLMEYSGHNSIFYDKNGDLYTTMFYGPNFAEKPAFTKLTLLEDNRLVPTVRYKKTTAQTDNIFTLDEKLTDEEMIVLSIKSKRGTNVYINDVFAFKVKSTYGEYANYIVSQEAMDALIKGENKVSFTSETTDDIDFKVEIWYC